MHGRHQLAQILSSRGLPSWKSASATPGRSGIEGLRSNDGSGLPIMVEWMNSSLGCPSWYNARPAKKANSASGIHKVQRITRPPPTCDPRAVP